MTEPTPEPTELIYLPADSWAPAVIAGGLAIAAAGIFLNWAYAVVGAAIMLGAMRSWWKRDEDEVARMRRTQRTETAVIPAEPLRRSS